MHRHERRQSPIPPEAGAHRHLAVRVIDQALRDIMNPVGSPTDRQSARDFLSGSAMLHFWCALADCDARCLIARASLLMAHARGSTAGRAQAPRHAGPARVSLAAERPVK
jgi:hypothetical protein